MNEFETMTPLACGFGPKSNKFSTCIWTNEIDDIKIFGITFGHNDTTMEDKVFQGVFNRGLLWTIDKLNSDGTIAEGYQAKNSYSWIFSRLSPSSTNLWILPAKLLISLTTTLNACPCIPGF